MITAAAAPSAAAPSAAAAPAVGWTQEKQTHRTTKTNVKEREISVVWAKKKKWLIVRHDVQERIVCKDA